MARSSRQLVLTQAATSGGGGGGDRDEGLPALGTVGDVLGALARYNTAPDGAPAQRNGFAAITLHGPGMIMEMAPLDGEVKQVMVTMTDDDFAFPVLMRLCREQRWTMLDPETGRRFGP